MENNFEMCKKTTHQPTGMTYPVNGLATVPEILFKLHFHRLQLIQLNVFHASLFI